ncbi:hypothetical protein VTO42DRAFT_5636 [Malbranchea cinnamomea]
MDPRKPREYILELFADPTSVRDVVKGVLHTIFFHRYFPCFRPVSFEVLDLTLPAIDDANVESYIDSRVNTLIQQHLSSSSNFPNGGVRGRVVVHFFEKRRRKSGLWFGGKNEEQVCWETWTIDITIAVPRTESERIKVRRAMEKMLRKAALKIVTIVNRDRDHIPPITTSDANPFPYEIVLNPKSEHWSERLGLY